MMWPAVIAAALVCSGLVSGTKNKEFSEKAEIWSRLVDCNYYESFENDYKVFEPLTNFPNSQPDGYIARFSYYAVGTRDAHLLLSVSNAPNLEKDWAYEILIGGWGNSRVLIRKKKSNNTITDLSVDDVLSPFKPLKILVEIKNNGYINVYLNNKAEPFISAYDPDPVHVKYVSFASFQTSQVEFLYNCVSDKSVSPAPIEATSASPADDSDLSEAPLDVLVNKCKWYEAWENEYKQFHKLSDIKDSQADGYLVKLPLYVFGARDAHIVLSATDKPNWEADNVYEIVIGAQKNTVQLLRRKRGEELVQEVKLPNLLSEKKQTKVVVQLSTSGKLEVFIGESAYKPLVLYIDEHPLDVKFISFDSLETSRVLFFYECTDRHAVSPAVAPPHALLAGSEATKEDLSKKCKNVHAWKDKYLDFIKVASIRGAQNDEFLVQLPYYVEGVRDANILLSADANADSKNSYEIIIGGWGNSRNLIRKNNQVLAKVKEFNILSDTRPVKIIVEVTKAGVIRVFTDHNKSKPLLEVQDDQPIKEINFVSFSAYYRDLDIFYNCVE